MKIKWSPLVGSASGTTADAVAASWKGIQYIRKHVIPHNPNTTAQQEVRNSLARCVPLWRSLAFQVKGWLDTYGVDYRMSGFNVFMSKCRLLEQQAGILLPVPPNPHVDAVADAAAVVGTVTAGDIIVTWAADAPTALYHVSAFAREVGTNRFSVIKSVVDGDATLTLSDLTPDTAHDVYLFYFGEDQKTCGTPTGLQNIMSFAG
ncbi:hypothetical protein ES705_31507 [subsurface metagenome]